MDLRVPPRLESRNTEEYMPTPRAQEVRDDTELEGDGPVKTSRLPYAIARHRKKANSSFVHAFGKEHGLKHIEIRRGPLALFWLAVFVTVMSLLSIMVGNLIADFVAMPVATQIKPELEVMQFPDVTMCSKVPFYTHETQNNADENNLDELLTDIRREVEHKLKDASIKITESGVLGALLIQMATKQDDSLLRAYQHVVYCQYHDEPCSFYNFTEIAHLRYVQCFTFSPDKRKMSGGKGLQFMFYRRHDNLEPFAMLNDLEDPRFIDPANDGIHIFVHNPKTFPTYEINTMPTSFSVRFGQQAVVAVSALKYQSDMSGRKSCAHNMDPYKYMNFRGGANYLSYSYTYEDCIANKKQLYIESSCKCLSDTLFVPFKGVDKHAKKEDTPFCRDIRRKTSQRLRDNSLCFDQHEDMPRTLVLDKYIPMDKLFNTREDLDQRKIERHQVCSLLCQKIIYSTRIFEVIDLDPERRFPPNILHTYMKQLTASQLEHPYLQERYKEMVKTAEYDKTPDMKELKPQDLIIVDIRMTNELIDVWEEELTESAFNLLSNMGGTLGLCAGISFLSCLFLIIFFGRAYYHTFVSLILWFWWTVYQGKPPATPLRELYNPSTFQGSTPGRTLPPNASDDRTSAWLNTDKAKTASTGQKVDEIGWSYTPPSNPYMHDGGLNKAHGNKEPTAVPLATRDIPKGVVDKKGSIQRKPAERDSTPVISTDSTKTTSIGQKVDETGGTSRPSSNPGAYTGDPNKARGSKGLIAVPAALGLLRGKMKNRKASMQRKPAEEESTPMPSSDSTKTTSIGQKVDETGGTSTPSSDPEAYTVDPKKARGSKGLMAVPSAIGFIRGKMKNRKPSINRKPAEEESTPMPSSDSSTPQHSIPERTSHSTNKRNPLTINRENGSEKIQLHPKKLENQEPEEPQLPEPSVSTIEEELAALRSRKSGNKRPARKYNSKEKPRLTKPSIFPIDEEAPALHPKKLGNQGSDETNNLKEEPRLTKPSDFMREKEPPAYKSKLWGGNPTDITVATIHIDVPDSDELQSQSKQENPTIKKTELKEKPNPKSQKSETKPMGFFEPEQYGEDAFGTKPLGSKTNRIGLTDPTADYESDSPEAPRSNMNRSGYPEPKTWQPNPEDRAEYYEEAPHTVKNRDGYTEPDLWGSDPEDELEHQRPQRYGPKYIGFPEPKLQREEPTEKKDHREKRHTGLPRSEEKQGPFPGPERRKDEATLESKPPISNLNVPRSGKDKTAFSEPSIYRTEPTDRTDHHNPHHKKAPSSGKNPTESSILQQPFPTFELDDLTENHRSASHSVKSTDATQTTSYEQQTPLVGNPTSQYTPSTRWLPTQSEVRQPAPIFLKNAELSKPSPWSDNPPEGGKRSRENAQQRTNAAHPNFETYRPWLDNVFQIGSDNFPAHIFDPPPLPLIQGSIDGQPGGGIYMPEDLPPLVDQRWIPGYILARYGDPPPYSTIKR